MRFGKCRIGIVSVRSLHDSVTLLNSLRFHFLCFSVSFSLLPTKFSKLKRPLLYIFRGRKKKKDNQEITCVIHLILPLTLYLFHYSGIRGHLFEVYIF